jgi:hypothetical protein
LDLQLAFQKSSSGVGNSELPQLCRLFVMPVPKKVEARVGERSLKFKLFQQSLAWPDRSVCPSIPKILKKDFHRFVHRVLNYGTAQLDSDVYTPSEM